MAQRLSDDDWHDHVTREAAKAIGQWLEARGRLHDPIRSLTLSELEALAVAAISRFVVLGVGRVRDRPDDAPDLTRLLLG